MSIAAMKQALEALEKYAPFCEFEIAALRISINKAEKVEPDYRAIVDAVVGNLEARKQVIDLDLEEELVEEIMQEMADTIRDGFTTPQPAPDGWQLVGYLDGRRRFFYADDPFMVRDHAGMTECYAAAPKPGEQKC